MKWDERIKRTKKEKHTQRSLRKSILYYDCGVWPLWIKYVVRIGCDLTESEKKTENFVPLTICIYGGR